MFASLAIALPIGAVLIGAGLVAAAWAVRRRTTPDPVDDLAAGGVPAAHRRSEVLANVGSAAATISSSTTPGPGGLPSRTAEPAKVGTNGNGASNGRLNLFPDMPGEPGPTPAGTSTASGDADRRFRITPGQLWPSSGHESGSSRPN